jgi:hypothetical protein
MTKVTSESAGSSAPKAAAPVEGAPPFKNVLHDYALYNYVFTLSVMSNDSINNKSYRTESLSNKRVILRTGSGQPNNRIPTVYTTDVNPSGKYDFFMDDLRIASAAGFKAAGGNTNATSINFKITEPYSMGMFFEALQTAAMANGNANYTQVPLLLMIEFYGHVTPDKQLVKVPNVTKYIPMRISGIDMKVTAAGAVYNVEAYPWAEKAFTDIHSELKTDLAIVGKTVLEMLKSGSPGNADKTLERVLNARAIQVQQAAGGDDAAQEADFYSITFPESSDRDDGFNEIALSKMGFDTKRTGMQPFGQEINVYDAATGTFKRSKSVIDPEKTEFKFAQGSDIVNVINQVILMSEYGRKTLDTVDETGMVKWWRIEPRVVQASEPNSTGSFPKTIYYRIIPYYVHVSKLSAPGTSLKGKTDLKRQALKEYNYIYTGKNLDVLDFDLQFKNSFYTQLSADRGIEGSDTKLGAQSSTAVGTAPKTTTFKVDDVDQSKNAFPNVVLNTGIKTRSAHRGGGALEDFKSRAARQFHDAITSATDQIELDLTILGDPYYLSDSGFGNYSAQQTQYRNMNSDGAMDYQSGEVDIIINFRVPVDNAGPNGLYQFPPEEVGILQAFSGLFQVLTLENNFSKGKFTQTLNLVRRRNQESKNREGNTVIVESKRNEDNSQE